jgi:hypothetical protein
MLAMFVIFVTNLFSSVSSAQPKVEKLLNKLDKHYYYPQNKGLKRISSRLTWQQENFQSKNIFTIKKPVFLFKGELKDGVFVKIIKIFDNSKKLTNKKNLEDIKFLKNYLDAFLPKTLREKFLSFKGSIDSKKRKEIVLLLKNKETKSSYSDYKLFIDTGNWRISKIIFRQDREPKKVEGKFFYTKKDGKWVVAETVSIFKINGQEYIEKTKYKYKALESFWLVYDVDQTVMQGGSKFLTYKFNLNDYQLNSNNKFPSDSLFVLLDFEIQRE